MGFEETLHRLGYRNSICAAGQSDPDAQWTVVGQFHF
jgi:hypothetical protein